MQRPMRVYADTSVFGGVFDAEFAQASRAFFEEVGQDKLRLVVSAVVEDELGDAPASVLKVWEELKPLMEFEEVTD